MIMILIIILIIVVIVIATNIRNNSNNINSSHKFHNNTACNDKGCLDFCGHADFTKEGTSREEPNVICWCEIYKSNVYTQKNCNYYDDSIISTIANSDSIGKGIK